MYNTHPHLRSGGRLCYHLAWLEYSQKDGVGEMASRIERFGDLWYLLLEGDARTRGRDHAGLVRGITGTETADYYARLLPTIIRQQRPRWLPRFAVRSAAALISVFFGTMQAGIDAGSLAVEMQAFLIGYRRGGAKRLIRFPDVLHWLAGMAGGQCSAVFFEGGVHSRLARNFDFYGPRVWGQHRAIKVSIPPSGQPWLWAGPLGIPVGGFGVNASGIAVMPFTNFTRDLSLRGLPLFTLMQTILEESHSLDDALAYLERARRHGGISLLVADMQRGETAAIAVGARRLLVDRPRDGVLVRTNHHHELDRPPQPGMSMWQRHSRSRWQRLDRLARDLPPGGGPDPLALRQLLADRTQPDGRRSLLSDVPGALNVATSIILDGMKLFCADAGFPACDATRWHGFSLDECFSGHLPDVETHELPDLLSQEERAAIALTVEGWSRYFDESQPSAARDVWSQARAHAPQEPALLRMLAMAAHDEGDRTACREYLESLLELDPGDEVARLALKRPGQVYLECMTGQLAPRR